MPLIPCPTCQKVLNIAEQNLGKTVRCSGCHSVFQTTGAVPLPPIPDDPVDADPPPRRPAKSYAVEGETKRQRRIAEEIEEESPRKPKGELAEKRQTWLMQEQAITSLKRASWCLFAGGMFGLLQFLVGCADVAYVSYQQPQRRYLGLGILLCVPVVAVAFTLFGSFQFRPRKSYRVAMMGAIFGVINGLLNVLPCLCCGSLSTTMMTGQGSDTTSGVLIGVIFLFVLVPATVLSLVGGIYGLKVLFRPEVKGLFLD